MILKDPMNTHAGGTPNQGPSPPLDATMTFRLTSNEKALLSFFAQAAGLSVGRFLMGMMKEHGEVALDSFRKHNQEAEALRPFLRECGPRPKKKAPKLESLRKGLRVPFLTEEHGRPYLRAIEHAAKMAGCEPHTVAWIASHLFEEIAHEVAENNVVRVPGVFVVGPWRIEGQGICVPRFQAARPFVDYLLTDGSREGANTQLQAHRRRSRGRLMNLPKSQEEFRIRVEAQTRRLMEDLDALCERTTLIGM